MKIFLLIVAALTFFSFILALGLSYVNVQLAKVAADVRNIKEEDNKKVAKLVKLAEQVSILEGSVGRDDKRLARIKQIRKAVQETSSGTKLSIIELTSIATAVVDYSEEFDVSISLILATMRKESAFKRDAISKVGAKGLMQLMPNTAKECADDIGKRHYNVFKIRDNIQLGTYYLWKMLDTFENDVSLALKAYNAGPVLTNKVEAGEINLNLDCTKDGKVDSAYPCETKFYEHMVVKWKKEYEDLYGLH